MGGGGGEGGVVRDVGSTYVSKYPLSPCIKLDHYYIVMNRFSIKAITCLRMAAAHIK